MKFIICFTLLFAIFAAGQSGEDSACGDSTWTKYKDEKCFKLFDNLVRREDADTFCMEAALSLDSEFSPTLTIKSPEEQAFLVNLIFEEWGVIDNVWLGAARPDGSDDFVWNDGSPFDYTNWTPGSPSNDTAKNCVQVTSRLSRQGRSFQKTLSANGMWTEVSCLKRNLVVCQKLQAMPLLQLQNIVLGLRKKIEEMDQTIATKILKIGQKQDVMAETIATMQENIGTSASKISGLEQKQGLMENNPVPIGFIYVQLPNQPEPRAIWPAVLWQEVSANYAGLFFRAAGGGAAAFGETQGENAPRITSVSSKAADGPAKISITVSPGTWTDFLLTGWTGGVPIVTRFQTSSGDS